MISVSYKSSSPHRYSPVYVSPGARPAQIESVPKEDGTPVATGTALPIGPADGRAISHREIGSATMDVISVSDV